MDIREPQSFFRLFAESFNLINRSFSALLAFLAVGLIGSVAVAALLWVGVPQPLVSLLNSLFSLLLSVVLIKLLAAKAEQDNTSLPDIMAASVLPSVYTLIVSLLCALAGVIAALLFGVLGKILTPWALIPLGLVGGYVLLRLSFVPFAISVRDQGPIEAISYSWQLTQAYVLYVLGVWLLSVLFPWICAGAILYGLYTGIPLFFAESLNITQLTPAWIGVLAAISLLFVCIWLAMGAYWVLVFLNLDYRQNRGSMPAVPLPQAQITEEAGVLPPGAGPAVLADSVQHVQILKASVKSQDTDDSLAQHLDQVYQPKPEDVIEYTEEDRMPTILFDDEMAKQMEQNRIKWEQEKAKSRLRNQPEDDENTSSIKMSK